MSPLVTLTAMQAQALFIGITQVIDYLARLEQVKDFTDEQCQILIENAKKTKEELDKRLAAH